MRTIKVVIAAGIVAGAIAWSVGVKAQRVVGPLPASAKDLATAQVVEVRDGAGTVVLKGTFSTKSETPPKVEREAALSGGSANTSANGKAEIELERSGGQVTHQEIEVGLKRLSPQATLKLYVDGGEVATFTTNRKGDAELKFTSRLAATK